MEVLNGSCYGNDKSLNIMYRIIYVGYFLSLSGSLWRLHSWKTTTKTINGSRVWMLQLLRIPISLRGSMWRWHIFAWNIFVLYQQWHSIRHSTFSIFCYTHPLLSLNLASAVIFYPQDLEYKNLRWDCLYGNLDLWQRQNYETKRWTYLKQSFSLILWIK